MGASASTISKRSEFVCPASILQGGCPLLPEYLPSIMRRKVAYLTRGNDDTGDDWHSDRCIRRPAGRRTEHKARRVRGSGVRGHRRELAAISRTNGNGPDDRGQTAARMGWQRQQERAV